MKRLLPAFTALLLPATVFAAIEFTESSDTYKDAPFPVADAAGISVLTNAGTVSGYPDGTFAPTRSLNRAEFVKIVLNLPGKNIVASGTLDCFPDVRSSDWFSSFVCAAKEEGLVQGNPDGLFHPERSVNYAEALKILSRLYAYGVEQGTGDQWYVPYATAAINHRTSLTSSLAYDAPLTRGQMARLAAAFYAESEGALDAYRSFERGKTVSSSSSSGSVASSSSSSSSSLSSSSSSSSSSLSSAASVSPLFPAASHFLIAGETTPLLMDAQFTSTEEEADLRIVKVKIYNKVPSLSSFVLVDPSGKSVATLSIVNDADNTDSLWQATLTDASVHFTKNVPLRLGIRAVMKAEGVGGVSNELLELSYFQVFVQGTSGATYQLAAENLLKPPHQTALGRITSVRNMLATSMSVQAGSDRTLATFAVGGRAVTGTTLQLSSLTFLIQSNDVSLSRIRIGGAIELLQQDCGVERGTQTFVTCSVIPNEYKNISSPPTSLSLFADVALIGSATTGSIQIRSIGNGSVGQSGSVRWTDGSGTFNWIESDVSLDHGPVLTITLP